MQADRSLQSTSAVSPPETRISRFVCCRPNICLNRASFDGIILANYLQQIFNFSSDASQNAVCSDLAGNFTSCWRSLPSATRSMIASVLLPLYVYPSTGAWDPLYQMASSYPRVQFTAIVNPYSGPGDSALPNENYTQAIHTLNALGNVRTIGYVATTWCTKNASSVLDEVAVYAGWGAQDPQLAMSGIFFDETPTHYTPEYASYLQTISQAVHNNRGLKDGYVVGGSRYMAPLTISPTVFPEYCMSAAGESRNWGT
ncbi:uncharacterized protein BDR25DRAFT_30243 [Lindgomyces ingoldianus]|uniref:Uncharacterized protein n=1 Tax=Lindgomyces ingoldianus TaxID=673940 RepID=A0ACB6QVP7_9PLEO|nr:uncharacterized protein BDR25DRAFT_30243 [Lindgomyces ingoldianus]KAF2471078.1 hypothetical protein BDR25DRAFT_30243 [Lindgomyces ingoldianus]